ncbi:hypothetical protein ACFL6T_01245 [Candidatus Zixiibacteriota bacterium]
MIQTLTLLAILHVPLAITPVQANSHYSPQGAEQEWNVLLHAHGVIAGDWDSVEDLQREAMAAGVDVVILTEQLIIEWEWSPPVVRSFWAFRLKKQPETRSLFEVFRTEPSVKRLGAEEYFEQAARADQAVPGITLLAGAEVAPYYYWTGVPWKRNLVMWNWQRNLLVLDLPEPNDYEKLPVLGMRTSLLGSWKNIPWAIALLACLSLFLYVLNKLYLVRASLALIPVALLIWSGPPSLEPFSPYRDDAGMQPYQTFIDRVNDLDGFSMWTQVETTDDHEFMGVRIHTSWHPEVLLETHDYRSLGSIYPSTTVAHEPGNQWDLALISYLEGNRRFAPWGWGELALHPQQMQGSNAKRIAEVLSVVRAPDRSPRAILDALKEGKGYAVRATTLDGRLSLDRFMVNSGSASALMGEELDYQGDVSVEASWSFTGDETQSATVYLIRSGAVVDSVMGVPPMSLTYREPPHEPGVNGAFYRLQIESRGHRLLSNPIFVRYGEASPPTEDQ